MTRNTESEASKEIDDIALKIASKRKRPLMVMFYDESAGRITHDDVRDVYDEFRRRGRSAKDQFKQLDVLLHSYGGDADACYRVAQVIRDFAANVTFLVPFHAASGATLICLCGNEIRLGAYASLGPIDITWQHRQLSRVCSRLSQGYRGHSRRDGIHSVDGCRSCLVARDGDTRECPWNRVPVQGQ